MNDALPETESGLFSEMFSVCDFRGSRALRASVLTCADSCRHTSLTWQLHGTPPTVRLLRRPAPPEEPVRLLGISVSSLVGREEDDQLAFDFEG